MGFLDKAKAAARDLAAKADTALGSSGLGGPRAAGGGEVDGYFRDLGVLAYLDLSGRPADPGERQRVTAALKELDARGAIRSFALHTTPPPPPGMAGTAVPPSGAAAPHWQAPPAVPSTPPPPPPSWMRKDEGGNG